MFQKKFENVNMGPFRGPQNMVSATNIIEKYDIFLKKWQFLPKILDYPPNCFKINTILIFCDYNPLIDIKIRHCTLCKNILKYRVIVSN